ncbi:hypothetical protein [Posidoniimonas corsicana]|uniref:hypothetical protein n=1 Tax=Posidoniimonas corsicana TaxID=1938618 RepID=UPI0011B815DB|nr:hypothetical protein [Posidoniimonas corsicana]
MQEYFEREGEPLEPPDQPTHSDADHKRAHGCHLPYCSCGYGDANHCACRSEAIAIAIYGASFAVVVALLSWLL